MASEEAVGVVPDLADNGRDSGRGASRENGRGASRERRLRAVELVRERGELEVVDLPALLGASVETIRRDLRALEDQGLVRRTYGRVFAVESGVFESSLASRNRDNAEEHLRIAKAAAGTIRHAQTIFLDEGLQTQRVAEQLTDDQPLTVVTASLPIAAYLAQRPNFRVIVLGGQVRGNTLGVADAFGLELVRHFSFDLAIIGANGVSVERGMTTPDPAVGSIKAAAVRNATRAVFVGAHYKFGRTTFISFAQLTDFDAVITGRELGAALANRFSAAGARMTRV
ncbi:MAG: DeoR/GlpR family DNA-binding transcription regulator [Bifidobacteriaceae bacterium]|jgi:DeoR/GlpR family transcriptional regulator of sugar metabolism|nr:DeoR/GlpR family DNA-binding transcription regulator [Bifidobacteriaceae bacterium]